MSRCITCCCRDAWPAGAFDLIVISEIGYYLGEPGLAALLDRAHSALLPEGYCSAVTGAIPSKAAP